jgi:hypothetical protein
VTTLLTGPMLMSLKRWNKSGTQETVAVAAQHTGTFE